MFIASALVAALLMVSPGCPSADPRPDSGVAVPCSCFHDDDPQVLLDRRMAWADLVVEARVVSIDTLSGPLPRRQEGASPFGELSGPVVATLLVTRGWRGEPAESVELHMTWAEGPVLSCDQTLELNRTYLVMASHSDWIGRHVAGACSGTAPSQEVEARGDFRRLGPPTWSNLPDNPARAPARPAANPG